MLIDRTTLTQFLIEERRRHPHARGDLNALILNVALTCRAIAKRVAHGAIESSRSVTTATNVQGEEQKPLDVISNQLFVRTNEWSGLLAGMVSEENDEPIAIPTQFPLGKYLLLFDPLDGSSNIDVNVSVGSIFSILRAPTPGTPATLADFLRPGAEQVAAGYAIYGPTTMFVLSVGTGTYGFTLEPEIGEFILTHPKIRIPEETSEFAINASNVRFWEPAVKRYVDECLAGRSGSRDRDFNMRWIASLVAETHRILMRGGVFLYPRDSRDPTKPGRLRLLYEANPISFIVAQAGGRSTSGYHDILDVAPTSLHQRIGLIFGSRNEVDRIEQYHRLYNERQYDAPLFGERGLFRGLV